MPVRLATPDDAQAIAEVHVAAWQAAYADLMPQSVLDALSVEQRLKSWQRTLSAPSRFLTAVATDRSASVVGFVLYGQEQDANRIEPSGELFAMNLVPQVWRCGRGRQMCDWVLAHARDQAWQSVALWVLCENARARAFYESMGFVSDGVEKADTVLIGASLNELRYRKWLPLPAA